MIEQASTYANDIDNIILLVAVLVGVWFFLAEGIFFWLIWRFRAPLATIEATDNDE